MNTPLEQKVADFLMERGCLKNRDANHCAKQLVKMIAPQLAEVEDDRNAAIMNYEETSEVLGCKIDELEKQNQAMREALEKLAVLGNEPLPGNSIGNRLAQDALKAVPTGRDYIHKREFEPTKALIKRFLEDHNFSYSAFAFADELARLEQLTEEAK